ncbi:MAG: hypothetical protein HY865_22525 [Chloroflexi bacterium]|nr:hypothetical protein [Chloroflexota bacterium]
MKKYLFVFVLLLVISCSQVTVPVTPVATNTLASTKTSYTGKNPWLVANTECHDADFLSKTNTHSQEEVFDYFQSMWSEAKVVPDPKIYSIQDLYATVTGTERPLSSIRFSNSPPCTWITLPSEKQNQYYLLFRGKENFTQKYILNNDAVLDVMVGQWGSKNSDKVATVSTGQNCTTGSYCISIISDCIKNKTVDSLPLFDVNSNMACFGSEENYVCMEYFPNDALYMNANGVDIPSCLASFQATFDIRK